MTSTPPSTSNEDVAPATVGQWFARLQPAPPPALADELRRLLKDVEARPVNEVPEACLETGEKLLEELMRSGSTERATALTLLAVDSLVTYAFEAASAEPAQMETRTANAMKRIAELAESSL